MEIDGGVALFAPSPRFANTGAPCGLYATIANAVFLASYGYWLIVFDTEGER